MSVPGSNAADRMNEIYRWQRGIYDLTRKFYLLGRDRVIQDLDLPDGGTVLEIGCGTGRNLVHVARRWPRACCHGLDVSTVMLDTARRTIARSGMASRITVVQADATTFDPVPLFGVQRFDRVLLSYTLSMIPPWQAALSMATGVVRPGGALFVVDFGRQDGLPAWFRRGLRTWLRRFDVEPRADLPEIAATLATAAGARLHLAHPYRGYAVSARMDMPDVHEGEPRVL